MSVGGALAGDRASIPVAHDLSQPLEAYQRGRHPGRAGEQGELQGILPRRRGEPFGQRRQWWERGVRLGLVPIGDAAIVGLDLVGVAVVHVDDDRVLEGDGVGDVEAVGGTGYAGGALSAPIDKGGIGVVPSDGMSRASACMNLIMVVLPSRGQLENEHTFRFMCALGYIQEYPFIGSEQAENVEAALIRDVKDCYDAGTPARLDS